MLVTEHMSHIDCGFTFINDHHKLDDNIEDDNDNENEDEDESNKGWETRAEGWGKADEGRGSI